MLCLPILFTEVFIFVCFFRSFVRSFGQHNTVADKNLGSVRYFGDRVPHAGQKKRIGQPDGLFVEGQAESGTRGSGNDAGHQ